MRLKYSSIFLILIYEINYCQCENENNLIKNLLKEFQVQHCIVVNDYYNGVISSRDVKYFARENFYTTAMSIDWIVEYLETGKYINAKTAVIIKTYEMVKVFKYPWLKSNADFMISHAIWILIDKTSGNLANEMKDFYIPFNCEFLIITPINQTFYKIDDAYNLGLTNNSQRQRHNLGNWSQEILTMTKITKEIRRFNMQKEKIYILSPFLYPCQNAYGCYYCEIVLWIGKVMNSTQMLIWEDNATDELEFLTTILISDTVYHASFFWRDRLGPIFTLKGYFHIKDDMGEEYGFSAYLAPFSRKLWRFIIYVALATSITSILIERYKRPKISLSFKIFQSFIAALKPLETLCNQCGTEIPEQTSSRLTWLSIRLTASLLVPAYSAAVISFITVSIPKLPFTDLTSFLQDGTYKTSGIEVAYSHSFFKASFDPVNQEITKKLLLNETPESDYEGMQWMCEKDFKFSYVTYNNDLYKFPHNECRIRKIPNPIFSIYTGLQMRFYSPYRKTYNMILYRFYTSGVLYKMKLGLVGKMPEVIKEPFVPLELNRINSLLLIVIFGVVLSFAFLLIEILLKD